MRRRVLLIATVAALSIVPPAAAQVVVPDGGDVDVNSGSGRTARTERTPGTGRTAGTGRTPGTPRVGDRGPQLPKTGSPIATIALDGITLLGAGSLLLRYRRRLIA